MKKTIYLLVMLTALFLIGCADAGKDQEVTSGETVTLDATASTTNFFGEIKKYQWKQVKHKRHKAPKVELLSKHSAKPTFIAPVVTKPIPLTFRLVTVEKGGYYSPWKTKDEVVIVVNPASTVNKLPQAIATVSSDSVKEGQSVTFDASNSNDTDGEIVSYEWKDANSTLLGSEVALVHTFAAVGTHNVTLTVTDDGGASDSTTLSVTVTELQPPVADINASASVVFINDEVTFDANGSSDSDGEIISYTWKDTLGNVLSDQSVFTHRFETSGEHNISLTVIDDDEQIASTTTTILVEAELVSVQLTIAQEHLEVGETTTLQAIVHYNDNTSEDVTTSVEWVVSDSTLVNIDANGTLNALKDGTTSIAARVAEVDSNTVSLEIIPLDTTPPTLTLNGEEEMTLILGSPYTELGATATDDRDTNITITQTGSVNVNSVGSYTITYTVKDKAGNVATLTRTIHVVLPPDVTPPVLTLNGESTITLHQGSLYTELGATATDERDGSVAVTTSGTVETSVVGQYTITYSATDSAGNSATLTRTVNVIDVTPPTLALNGQASMTLEQFATYTELGATATDAVDGSLPVIITGNVDTSTVGTYTLTYSAKDTSGNEANITRTITVIDVTPPVITLNGESNITLEQGTPYVELGATATDAADGSVNVEISGSVDTTKVGGYTITYTAIDSAGNNAILTRTVNIIDVTPPVITLNGEQTITLEQNEAYVELGATATDNSDGDLTVEVSGSVDTSTVGEYVVTYKATDNSGNSETATRTIRVVDVTPPVITLNGEQNITLTIGESYEELGATATDTRDGDVNVTIEGNVNTVIEGNYTIRYIAADQFGNQSQMSRNVNISREQPIKLQLTVEQKDFINKKDSFYNRHLPVQTSVNVIAIYDDGRSEEITNLVQWHYIDDGNISVVEDTLWVKHGTYEISASLDGIYSNTITVEVENDESMIQHNIRYFNDYRNISVELTPNIRPSDIVTLTLKLDSDLDVVLSNNKVIFSPENWDNGIKTMEVLLSVDNDINRTKDIILMVDRVLSNDEKYHGLEVEPIIISKPDIILNTPSMRQRKGAIRGVTIHFRLTSGDQHETKITLVDPPEGMMIVGPTHVENTELYGVDVEWNVPFDVVEGEVYDITAKAIDSMGREKVLTFSIKIPQTTIIPIKIEENELMVIDQNSPLYGLKMKGHNGEDLTHIRLRSVSYEDVWRHIPDENQEGIKLNYVVFVVDNMPEKLDVKMPNKFNSPEKWISKNVEIYKYDDSYFNELYQWDKSIVYSGGYEYEKTPGLTIPHKTRTYERAGSKIYLFVYQETK